MDLSQRTDLKWDNKGIPSFIPTKTVIDKGILEPIIQEFFNALVLSGVPVDTDVTQLYHLLQSIRHDSSGNFDDIVNQVTQTLANFNNSATTALNNFAQNIDQTNATLLANMNRAYANINAAEDTIQNQLRMFAQAICGMPFAWPSDSVMPPKWFQNIPVKQPDGSYAPTGGTLHELCMVCDGSSFDTSLYPMLAKVYPNGTLPDLRDQFIRGWNASTNVNPDNTPVMGKQIDALWSGVKPGENNGTFKVSATEQGDASGWLGATGCFSAMPGTSSYDEFAGGHGSHSKHDVYDNQALVTLNLGHIDGMVEHLQDETRPRNMPMTWLVYCGIHEDDLGVGARNS